jgi:hypothetical protein
VVWEDLAFNDSKYPISEDMEQWTVFFFSGDSVTQAQRLFHVHFNVDHRVEMPSRNMVFHG